jgi:hypothetical protein
LDFVALNPTYMSPVLLPNAKPNNGRFRNQTTKAVGQVAPQALPDNLPVLPH